MAFLVFTCPALVVMCAICLVLEECHKDESEKLNAEIKELQVENDSLRKDNETLKVANRKYQTDKEIYIKLDVVGWDFHKIGEAVVNTARK